MGPVDDDGFLSAAAAHVKEAYIKHFPEAHFSLMALGPAQAKGSAGS